MGWLRRRREERGECHEEKRTELGRDRECLNSEGEGSVHHKPPQITSLPS